MDRPELVQAFITALGGGQAPPTLEMIEAAFKYIAELRTVSTVRAEQHMIALPIVEQFTFHGEYSGDIASLNHVVNLILDLENNKPVPGVASAGQIGLPTKFDAPQQFSAQAASAVVAAPQGSGFKMTADGLVPDPWAGSGGFATNPNLPPAGVTAATNGVGALNADGQANPFLQQPSYAVGQPIAPIQRFSPAPPVPPAPAGPLYLYQVKVGEEPAESVVAPSRGAAIAKSKLLAGAGEESGETLEFSVRRISEVTI